MSWAEEDWTVGLSGRVLQKVKELQVHQERLSRENKQKQLQLDNIQTSLEKQTVKYEEVRGELQSVQKELRSAREEAKAAVTSRERLNQDLQTKQALVCSFEGQLEAARTVNNKLTQEVKRLEAEVDKLQTSSRSADTTLFSTPCWNTASPWEQNGRRKEERPGHRDEGQTRALHVRQQLQFSEVTPASLPRQQHKNTPHRHPSDQSDCFSTPLAAFPWERDDSRPAAKRRSPPSPQTPCTNVISQGQSEQGVCGKEKDHRAETDISLSDIRSRVSALEEELCAKTRTLKSLETEMAQSKKELAAREHSIQRARDELSLAHTHMAQQSERASSTEQKLKQLQEELKCQRQNAESSRLQHQQRSKELEKQHQRDLAELQKERLCLEKQHQQEVNKLNQELQQARTLHNALQAQADKLLSHDILYQLSLQKQVLEKELDTLKEKLKWTEGQLQESHTKEAQTQAKLTEAVHKAEGVAVSLEQSRKREQALEEEGRRLAEERADALRLLKEVQEQNIVPAPLLQPVQFCPVGQSFSPQPSYPVQSQPSPHIKGLSRDAVAEQRKEEREDTGKRRTEITASYPSDREPGEGIDSEHITVLISPDSECIERGRLRRKSNEEESKSRNELIESDNSGTIKHSTSDYVLCSSSHSAASTPTSVNVDNSKSEQAKTSEDLKRENAALRSELHDAREELQKRLEDLEAQRRAEAETRTRLKQLSRKHASLAVDKGEQDKEWRAQLESERAETERLRKAMAALETELERRVEEREKDEGEEQQEEEKNGALQDQESEIIELNIQLKNQLAEVKAQLTLEREERKREEEERNQMTNRDIDVKKELSMKLEELESELEELKRSRREDSMEEEKLSLANSPLTYLTLHDDELNFNTVSCGNVLLPSPEQHLLFCKSTNQRNMFVSQEIPALIQEEQTVIESECSPLSDEELMGRVASEVEDIRQEYMGGSSLSEARKTLSELQKDEPDSSDLTQQVKRLQKEKAKATEHANQCQVKLELLQTQVTRQTHQLTTAFEKQSQHICDLLAELQEKESALLCHEEELQCCKQELDALKAQKDVDEKEGREEVRVREVEDEGLKEETREGMSVEASELQPNQKKECGTCLTTSFLALRDSNGQRDASQPETPNHDSAIVMIRTECGQDGGTADMAAEVLALRRENQLLKQRIKGLTVSESNTTALHRDSENHEDSANAENAALSCSVEQRSPSVHRDIATEAPKPLLQNVKTSEDQGEHLEREIGKSTSAEEELDAACQLQIDRLQQQVVELQTKLRALSEETLQQAEELALWRVASQPAPTFDQLPSVTQDQNSAVRRSQSNQQQQADEATHSSLTDHTPVQSPANVAVIREDELLLSCSSNKLQGRMLFSRLQHSNFHEPKSVHPSKKTATLQEPNQDPAKIDKESEKENQDINLLHQSNTCQTQNKEKRDTEVIQVSLEKTSQQRITKDSHKVSGPKQTKIAECFMGNPETKPGTSRVTSDSSDRALRTEMRSVCSQTDARLCPPSPPAASQFHCAYTQTEEEQEEEEEEEDEEELVESPPVSPVPLSGLEGVGDKMLFSGSFPIPADPARLAERIRRNRTQLSAAFDDTEYEPYGLPEVVMKGFADIPSGPSCPYIVRRGLLGTTVVPVPPKDQRQEETD